MHKLATNEQFFLILSTHYSRSQFAFDICRAGEKHLDSSGASDSELDMPSGIGGSNSQGTSKGSHNSNMSSGLQHNLLLQQSLSNNQLGECHLRTLSFFLVNELLCYATILIAFFSSLLSRTNGSWIFDVEP
jgi:hypothetical protein